MPDEDDIEDMGISQEKIDSMMSEMSKTFKLKPPKSS